MLELSLIITALVVLIVAVVSDLKTLEVPDWINYAGIAAGLGIHLIFSLEQWHYWPFASSILGLGAGFAFACLMFYTGQWGGGDAKLMMAMGALIGLEPNPLGIGAGFMINLVLFGALWGLIWSIGVGFANGRNVWRTYKSLRRKKQYRRMHLTSLATTAFLLLAAFVLTEFEIELFILAASCYTLSHLVMFAKSIELSGMHKWVTPDKLTEGDWLIHEVKVGKIHVKPPKLGLEKEHVDKLMKLYKEKKIKKVLVKYGVPFTPSFLLAFLFTLKFGNFVLATIL